MSRFRPPLSGAPGRRPQSAPNGPLTAVPTTNSPVQTIAATAQTPAANAQNPSIPRPVIPQPLQQKLPGAIAPWKPAEFPLRDADKQIGPLILLLGALMLMYVVPMAEIIAVYLNIRVPVVVIVWVLLALVLPFTGRMGLFLKTPVAKPWLLTGLLFMIASVIGQYPGRSAPFIFQYLIRFHTAPFLCCALAVTTRQIRHLLYWICGGAALLLGLCAKFGAMSDDRFVLPETTMSNPNDLGFLLVFGVACFFVLLYSHTWLKTLIWLALFPVSLYFILKTGSRANLVTLVVMGAVILWISPRVVKLAMVVALPLATLLILVMLPATTRARLTMVFSDPEKVYIEHPEMRGAVGSQIARQELQRRAIDLSLRHPLLGVGALMFEDAVEDMVHADTGRKSGWQQAHNTYLEISAENGIPAFILYVWSIVWCLQINYKAIRITRKISSQKGNFAVAVSLFLITVSYATGITFCNSAYDPKLTVLVGLSVANAMAMQRELDEAKKIAATAA